MCETGMYIVYLIICLHKFCHYGLRETGCDGMYIVGIQC